MQTALLFGAIVAGVSGAEPPRIVYVGTLPGDQYPASWAYAVSGDGKVVVGDANYGFMFSRAFRWREEDGIKPLTDAPIYWGQQTALAINADGSVVAGYQDGAVWNEAFRWTARDGAVPLGFLPGGNQSGVFGMNSDGTVLVGSSGTNGYPQAMYWTEKTGMVGLGFLPADGFNAAWSTACAASADGRVIVGYSSVNGEWNKFQAFRWTAEEGMVGLGYLPEGDFSCALDVSDDGQVIVGEASGTGGRGFRWSKETGMIGISGMSSAWGVSGDGSLVVGDDPHSDNVCFWTERTGVVDLRQWLIAHGVPGLGKKYLYMGGGISSDGRTIAGTSSEPVRGFVAYLGTPCEADCNDDGALDVDDFVCFQTFFAKGSLVADCDKSGSLDIDDFICFQSAFGAGCP